LDVDVEAQCSAANCIITADDSSFVRELLKGMLIKRGLARTVIAVENGQEFIAAFNKCMVGNESVEAVILDLEMPVMDGITAARTMRVIEEKYQVKRIPILFFSARKCDDALKQHLDTFSPAVYINKGSSTDPAGLTERVDRLITHILQKNTSKGS
jgi:CheY-like chemotaxis protein